MARGWNPLIPFGLASRGAGRVIGGTMPAASQLFDEVVDSPEATAGLGSIGEAAAKGVTPAVTSLLDSLGMGGVGKAVGAALPGLGKAFAPAAAKVGGRLAGGAAQEALAGGGALMGVPDSPLEAALRRQNMLMSSPMDFRGPGQAPAQPGEFLPWQDEAMKAILPDGDEPPPMPQDSGGVGAGLTDVVKEGSGILGSLGGPFGALGGVGLGMMADSVKNAGSLANFPEPALRSALGGGAKAAGNAAKRAAAKKQPATRESVMGPLGQLVGPAGKASPTTMTPALAATDSMGGRDTGSIDFSLAEADLRDDNEFSLAESTRAFGGAPRKPQGLSLKDALSGAKPSNSTDSIEELRDMRGMGPGDEQFTIWNERSLPGWNKYAIKRQGKIDAGGPASAEVGLPRELEDDRITKLRRQRPMYGR